MSEKVYRCHYCQRPASVSEIAAAGACTCGSARFMDAPAITDAEMEALVARGYDSGEGWEHVADA